MTDLERLHDIIAQMRTELGSRPHGIDSPIAMAMQDEADGPVRKFMLAHYLGGGIPQAVDAMVEASEAGASMAAILRILEEIAKLEARIKF